MKRRILLCGITSILLVVSLVTPSALAAAVKTVDPSLYSSLQWRNIGPQMGGRSLSGAGSSARPNEYFFGATGGGLWKTTDGGASWAPVTDGQISSSSVGAVAVCPSNPDVVYIGTGEVDLRGTVIPGDGMYKSTDDGKTWQHIGLSDAQTVGQIRIDPNDCNHAYVAALGHVFGPNTERGVFRTTDGGATWQKVLYVDNLTGAVDMSMDPSNPNVLYASMWRVYRQPWLLSDGGSQSGLYKSTDGGTTWTNLTPRFGLGANQPVGKIGVSVSGADPNRVYALVEARPGGGLFRSDDAGATWKLVNESQDIRQRAFYFTKVWADTTNPDRVYFGNVSFMRSDDAGVTLTTLRTPHSDNHGLWIDPTNDNRMIETNDGGAAVSTDGARTFTNENYSTAQIYNVATTNDDPYLVCGEQQDRGTSCVSSTGGTNAISITGGSESGPIAVDPSNSNVFYVGDCCGPFTGAMSRFDRSGQSALGARRIDVWPNNPQGQNAGSVDQRFQWTYPLVTNPAEPDAVYAGSQSVWKTTNGGQGWQQISPDLSYADPSTLGDSGGPITLDQDGPEYYATVFSIAPSQVNKKIIWAGTDDGRVWVTHQGGGKWHEITPPALEKFTRVSRIDAGHGSGNKAEDTAYLAGQRYQLDDTTPIAYRTHDGGDHWTKITNGIAAGDFLWTIRQDPQRSDLLYASTQHGVYVSFDDGDNWQPLRLNLPDTQVYDLQVKANDLVISTHGRGFYVCDDCAQLLRTLTPKTTPADIAWFHQTVPPVTPITPVSPPPATIPPTTPAPDADNSLATLHDPNNPVRSVSSNVSVSYTLKQNVTSASMQFLAPDGTVVATNTLPTTAGSRTTTWNLRYPDAVSFPGLVYWSASNQGPKAPLGTYTARLVVNGQPLQESFDILKDSRLTHVTAADIDKEFQLDLAVRDATSDANQDVINIRACTTQVDDRVTAANSSDVTAAGTALDGKLNTVQNALHESRNVASEDPLNFGIKINNKIASLHSIIESVDGVPTDQDQQVFDEVNAQLQIQLKNLRDTVGTDVLNFNQLIAQHGLPPISCSAV